MANTEDVERLEKMIAHIKHVSGSLAGAKPVKSKKGVLVYASNDEKNPIKQIAARMLLQSSLEEFLLVIESDEHYVKVDSFYVEGKVVEQLDEHTKVMYSHYKGILMISDRDFVYIIRKEKQDDGFVIATTSVEREDVKEVPGRVRAWVYYSGWHVQELVDEPSPAEKKAAGYPESATGPWLRLTYAAQADPKGWIPTIVINKVNSEIANLLLRMQTYIAKMRKTGK